MNSTSLKGLSAAQINAIAGALAKSTPPPPPATLDGTVLYRDFCSGCHGALASSSKAGATAARITGAIGKTSIPAMNSTSLKGLSAAQINAIAGALAKSTPPPPPPTVDGPTLYTTYCSGCHGPLATSAKSGRTAAQIQTSISSNAGGVMGSAALKALNATQVQAIAAALATVTPPPSPSSHPANWYKAHRSYVESNGTSTCQSCHGADLRGGAGPSCYTCHGKKW